MKLQTPGRRTPDRFRFPGGRLLPGLALLAAACPTASPSRQAHTAPATPAAKPSTNRPPGPGETRPRSSSAPIRPWWDEYPAILGTDDPAIAAQIGATADLCGSADDAAWGLYGQRLRIADFGKRAPLLHAAGIKALSWVEGYGNPDLYVIQIKKNPDGTWVKTPGVPDLTRVFANRWDWDRFDGTGVVAWVGVHTYFDNVDYARPYTRLNPRYPCPPMTYPDGTIATGYNGPSDDPRNSRVFDAGCGKDVLGRMWGDARGKALITDVIKQTRRGRKSRGGEGETRRQGEGETSSPAFVVPDPGYTPQEWAERTRQVGALLQFDADKDSACPRWIDYARAETRMALDAGIDGFWVDNFSPWDSFNANPVYHAFGEWSVARFRDYLRTHFTADTLQQMGVQDLRRFDVRIYLQNRVRAWGGNPQDLNDPVWRDPRWQDDPIWRAYLIYRRLCGTEELSGTYRVMKEEGAKAGKPDFLVMGNDIPLFSLGWPRGDLDMVSTELSWGWGLTTGPRGLMPPPLGSYVPVYKLAREHARSRFVNAWMYVPDEEKGKSGIANVLYYQGLSAHAFNRAQGGTAGNAVVDRAFFQFVHRAAPTFGRRVPVEEVGLYYSSSSQLMEMLPGGFRDHASQPHSFSLWGWGTALTWLHLPWRMVPEWKLTPAMLHSLKVLIVPNSAVFPAEDVPIVARWVRAGGKLIVSGPCGERSGEADNFARCHGGSTLAPLSARSAGAPSQLGSGRVLTLREDPGFPFYMASKDRPAMLSSFSRAIAAVEPEEALAVSAPGVSWKVGITPYQDRGKLFIDINNTDIDLPTDRITPAAPLELTAALPAELRGKPLLVRILSPDPAPRVRLSPEGRGRIRLQVGSVPLYASVVIEAAPPKATG